ncbi:hypothetical protein SpiGrapes_0252 [Sphaerochaeta pleomorpha str. Grapes]|uniref:Uncharacterized protein n=1 Tax=Sphaerochaeta pleomorpha (strain ATCC BAA-1885 / DSM 22778 / Grapes) TaxID=158190 RepID=G8QUT9_SPHPG|nr:hypothetical protein [Sphaerochaeta pleomorpha]AEV28115.1 hypothetical protein SpiGrapes_0252 [Sphaerochaeta pleomorpha str. Grapes]
MQKGICLLLIVLCITTPLVAAQDATAVQPEKTSIFVTARDYLESPEVYQVLATAHDWVGYSAVGLGIGAAVFNPGLVDDDLHKTLGTAAIVASSLSIGIGLLNYSNRFSTSKGNLFQKDNIHIVLGIVGGLCMLATQIFEAEDDNAAFGASAHSILGGVGASLMAASVVIQLF